MFSIRYDAVGRLLHLRLDGFWTLATLARFAAELLVAVTSVRLRHGGTFGVLSDSRDFPVQSAMVSKGFGALMAKGAKYHRGRTAIVVGSVLNRLQVQQSMAAPNLRVFLDMEEARAWLRGEGEEKVA